MRITGGRLAGRQLLSPGGRVRPTAEGLRDRWLSQLESELKGARLLEIFAGTGALGLEALSRGARSVDFVEWNPSALHSLKGNVTALGLRKASRIFTQDALEFIRRLESHSYDVALADPPYTSTLAHAVAAAWLERPFSRVLSVEHAAGAIMPDGGGSWTLSGSGITTWRSDQIHAQGEAAPPASRPPH